jgi:hypothetical protein
VFWENCRSDIAWKDAKYGQIWEFLRDEFELTQSFANLDYKLKFVEVLLLLSSTQSFSYFSLCRKIIIIIGGFAAQRSFPSRNTSEQEISYSGVANHYPD